jgi:hypothetical protein
MSYDEHGRSINENNFLEENQDGEFSLCSGTQKIQEPDLHAHKFAC